MKTLKLQGGGYEAEFLPEYGGNCVRLRELSTGSEILRTPSCEEDMRQTPLLYGTPLLVPPNRIGGGTFTYRGEKYVFPLNEPDHGNHCHGELYRTAAEVVRLSESEAAFRFVSDPSRPYLGFPHPCALTLTYALSARGLSQILRIQNFDSRPMPFAAAFHTTFNLAFEGGDVGEYSLYMPVKREFLREMKNYLPTGETDDNFKEKKPLNEGVWKPSENAITKFTEVYAAGCEIIHNTSGNRVAYTADPLYKYRHIFNGGSREFICIEPQTCRIDGLNVWKNEDVGIVEVAAGAEISLHSNIRLITEALREGNGA